jgi:hypothetical protein
LKLDEYKGPITRSKSQQIFVIGSENNIHGISMDMEKINEQPQDEHHEERQGGGRDATRNK